jgi:hypothetical protein
VESKKFTAPAYPAERTPRFNIPTLDADMAKVRSTPAENLRGKWAARMAEARKRAREARQQAAKQPVIAAALLLSETPPDPAAPPTPRRRIVP